MIKSPIAVITDTAGTTASVKAASTPAVATDKALVVAVSPNNPVTATITGVSTLAAQTDGTQRTKITDGTTNAAVKAASTAPVAADPALVVAISPNSPQTLVDNAAFTDGSSRVTPAGFIFDEAAGTALTENDVAAGRVDAKRAQVSVIEDATSRGVRAGVKPANTAALNADPALVVTLSPNGNQATESTLVSINSKIFNGLQLQSSSVAVSMGINKSFTAVSDMFTPQANADDIFYIRAGSRNVYINRIWISVVSDSGEVCQRIELIKRSTPNANGTNVTIVPHSAGDGSSVNDIYYYTANGALGTVVGKLWGGHLTMPHKNTPKLPVMQPIYTWEWTSVQSTVRPIHLRRDTEDGLAINLCSDNPGDLLVYCGVEWWEE